MENSNSNENLTQNENPKIRYAFLDELRGFLVLCMIITPAVPFFAGAFITLSGMMCGFSHSNLLRGVKCLAIATVITVVTVWGSNYFEDIAREV